MEESKLTKAVRPAAVVWVIALNTLVILADGNLGAFEIKEVWVPLITTLSVTIIGFFFTSRGVEKTTARIFDKDKGD